MKMKKNCNVGIISESETIGTLYCSLRVKNYYRVELQGQTPTTLPIKGCVVERTLELLDQDQRKIECLRFGATYYGTDRTEWA